MGHFKQGELDFIDRTLKILKQYEDLDLTSCDDKKYEVTLLMNCFLGLIVIPHEVWFSDIPKGELSNEWHIKKSQIIFPEKEVFLIKDVVTKLRDAIAHGDVSPLSSDQGEYKKITHLRFKAYTCSEKKTMIFEAEIPVETIKKFAIKFAETMIENIKKS